MYFRLLQIALAITASFFIQTAQAFYAMPLQADGGMVVSDQIDASKAGVEILKKGGNAIDAAVAVGYALAVTDPCCGNIGGGGFMLLHLADGQDIFLNFREKAPAAASPQLFLNKEGQRTDAATVGFLSVGVPGTVMGLNTALKRYGTLPLAEVMAPAIRLASQGFVMRNSLLFASMIPYLKTEPNKNVASIFLDEKGERFSAGHRLQQPQLAKTLTEIAQKGTEAFYKGDIAHRLIAGIQKQGGIMTLKDLADYTIQIKKPLTCAYHGYQVMTAPPPSSGVIVCEILKIVEPYPLSDLGFHSAQATQYNVEAMRYAFADRNRYLGDPDFIQNPVTRLLSPKHIRTIRSKIRAKQAGDSDTLRWRFGEPHEGSDTTHYVVADKAGNVVSTTYTLNTSFGAKVIAGDTGFFLNNEMDDFSMRAGGRNFFGLVQGTANLLEPGKRPLSSMSPTIVKKDNKAYLALGAAGGSTIINSVLQTIENVVDFDMDIQSAVNSPRYHMQWLPDTVFMEPLAFSQDTLRILQAMGYSFTLGPPYYSSIDAIGKMSALSIDAETGILLGADDARVPSSSAEGYVIDPSRRLPPYIIRYPHKKIGSPTGITQE